MQHVHDYVEPAFLQQSTPRPISPVTLIGLIVDHAFQRPSRTLLRPLFVVGVATLFVLLALHSLHILFAVPLVVLGSMLLADGLRVWRQVWEDVRLLRHGLLLRATIFRLRPNRTLAGEIDGALLDCAISVAPRRTYICSIWIADGNEAMRLNTEGRMQVLCLPYAPASWRVLDPIRSHVRYDRVSPSAVIPSDD